jgi:hypothetical protein
MNEIAKLSREHYNLHNPRGTHRWHRRRKAGLTWPFLKANRRGRIQAYWVAHYRDNYQCVHCGAWRWIKRHGHTRFPTTVFAAYGDIGRDISKMPPCRGPGPAYDAPMGA